MLLNITKTNLMPSFRYRLCKSICMHVVQTQLVNYSYVGYLEKNTRLVRWWHLLEEGGKEIALPFTLEEEDILLKYMDDHPHNFPSQKRQTFESANLLPPQLSFAEDDDNDYPCVLLIRRRPSDYATEICRRMDIVLQHDELPVSLPFDIVGEIVLEKV